MKVKRLNRRRSLLITKPEPRLTDFLGFPERNIQLLIDERARKSGIEKTLEAWLPNQAKKSSRIFLYYSGHGAPEPAKGESYIVPYDGDPNTLANTGYAINRLYESLGRLKAGR